MSASPAIEAAVQKPKPQKYFPHAPAKNEIANQTSAGFTRVLMVKLTSAGFRLGPPSQLERFIAAANDVVERGCQTIDDTSGRDAPQKPTHIWL